MTGIVTSYTSGTGALVINSTYFESSGTFTDWTVTISIGSVSLSSPGAIGSITPGTGAFTTLTSSEATTFTRGTSSTTTGTGTLVVTGGVGVSENLNVGGALTIAGNLTVNGTTTTVNSSTLSVDDINITLGDTASPTDVLANGGGITLKGATDKTLTWNNTTGRWTFNQPLDATSIQNTPIGSTAPSTGAFTTITASSTISGSNLSGTNTGDNATNTQYVSDYRAANFVAGTNYQVPLVSGTNIKTVGGISILGSGDIPTASGSTIREQATATASQTIFNLTNTYTPGANALWVYINGVRQHPGTFTETNSTRVTFSAGLNSGDAVLFEIGIITSGSSTAASAVSYSPTTNLSDTTVQAGLTTLANRVPVVTGSNLYLHANFGGF
jgi:hypothetical protein